ncbi:tRNA epoxyqueuosine(34) reductase QueG [Shewanella sp. NIFS-20-20]|uniref:tRNA epoxyqueuosine(34) reductase QueG n=1 Tax=Shewanella sp. NIFS-20-20 TaxID=2853806 RepID=UPI001C45D537|nr:tRNA epoxyqueuosine(34) reductase QueG [Shewanella sp. NIFS-20-20]MBV7315983.1 tRNA epoxyqueuosine(34) reductase QueG [Shewanella sp. NIFS-20-20]
MPAACPLSTHHLAQLASDIKQWGQELGFAAIGITDTDLRAEEPALAAWLAADYHGDMHYMAQHGMMRARPQELHPGCLRVISARMDYLPTNARFTRQLNDPTHGYISRYAGGRDYHKLLRQRLKKLGDKIAQVLSTYSEFSPDYRPFVDSAPILERPLAQKAGLGWTGKHSLLLNEHAGSWFFLGELLINLPLPVDAPNQQDCGACTACITSCPTAAIVAPYTVDARRCISYLTIELDGPIPLEFRPLIGNRIYGCDDCQLVCPHNRDAPLGQEPDFQTREVWQDSQLLSLFAWDEAQFLSRTAGSPIRRIGHRRWLRNLSVALGNAPSSPDIIAALKAKLIEFADDAMLTDHLTWALTRQQAPADHARRKTARLIRIIEKGLSRDA